MNNKQTVRMNTAYAFSTTSFRWFLNFWILESHHTQTQSTRNAKLHHNFPPNLPFQEWKTEYVLKNHFNAQGNRIRVAIDYGDDYTQMTENAYAIDNAAVWHLGRFSLAMVRLAAPSKRVQNKTAVHTSEFIYNSNGPFLLGVVQPDNALAVTTTYTRNPKRQVTSTLIDLGGKPAVLSKANSVLVDATGRFYTKIMNAFRHTDMCVHDSTRGSLLPKNGSNSRTTHFTYNALERVIREGRPEGTCATMGHAYDDSQSVRNPRNDISATSKYRVTITNSVALPSKAGYDRISRAIRASIVGFNRPFRYTAQANTQAKTIYNGRKATNEFDAADQTLNRVYLPQSAGGVNPFDHRYESDSIGNRSQCTSELENFTENITHACLNRLTDATPVGASTVAVRYDDLGTTTNHTTSSGLSGSGTYGYVTQDGFTSEASLASDKETAVTLVVIANDAAERL